MAQHYPLPQLIDEWIAWARWASKAEKPQSGNPHGVAFFELSWLVEHEPERAWEVMLKLVAEPRAAPFLGQLGAGPMEDLLWYHGADFIDRVEHEAKASPQFARVLGGVWRFQMSEETRSRVRPV